MRTLAIVAPSNICCISVYLRVCICLYSCQIRAFRAEHIFRVLSPSPFERFKPTRTVRRVHLLKYIEPVVQKLYKRVYYVYLFFSDYIRGSVTLHIRLIRFFYGRQLLFLCLSSFLSLIHVNNNERFVNSCTRVKHHSVVGKCQGQGEQAQVPDCLINTQKCKLDTAQLWWQCDANDFLMWSAFFFVFTRWISSLVCQLS